MSKGLVLLGKAIGLRRQHQSGYPVTFLAYRVEYSGKTFRIFGLRDEEVGRVGCDLFGNAAVGGALQEDRAAVTHEVLLQKTGNEVFFDIKDRLHENKNAPSILKVLPTINSRAIRGDAHLNS